MYGCAPASRTRCSRPFLVSFAPRDVEEEEEGMGRRCLHCVASAGEGRCLENCERWFWKASEQPVAFCSLPSASQGCLLTGE